AGDEVLRQVAHTLGASLRGIDRIGRYGGEEFAVLLPHADLATAMAVAERLRGAVEQLRLEGIGTVTISVGLAPLNGSIEDRDAWLSRADAALYRAKAQGRNRVEVASEATGHAARR